MQESFYEVLELLRSPRDPREIYALSGDCVQELHLVLVLEGRPAAVHLVQQGAETPPVSGLAVALLLDDFGGKVLGRPADSKGHIFVFLKDTLLGKAEVR